MFVTDASVVTVAVTDNVTLPEAGIVPIDHTPVPASNEPVVADEAYVIESIEEPNATRVDGYSLPMPQVDLSDDEIASILAYIRELDAPPVSVAP